MKVPRKDPKVPNSGAIAANDVFGGAIAANSGESRHSVKKTNSLAAGFSHRYSAAIAHYFFPGRVVVVFSYSWICHNLALVLSFFCNSLVLGLLILI